MQLGFDVQVSVLAFLYHVQALKYVAIHLWHPRTWCEGCRGRSLQQGSDKGATAGVSSVPGVVQLGLDVQADVLDHIQVNCNLI